MSLIVGWDIGGVHTKICVLSTSKKIHAIQQIALPIWKDMHQLTTCFCQIKKQFCVGTANHAITMTAELSDVFENRLVGVEKISSIWRDSFPQAIGYMYSHNGDFVKLTEIKNHWTSIASANWHASAMYLSTKVPNALLVDIGSTTTDIVPWQNHRLLNIGNDDASRLEQQELLYLGAVRTPIMAITDHVPFKGNWRVIMNERFAEIADVYRVCEQLLPAFDIGETADNRSIDPYSSIKRIARLLGEDIENRAVWIKDKPSWKHLIAFIKNKHINKIAAGIVRQLSRNELNKINTLVGAGIGSFLVKEIAYLYNLHYIDAADLFEKSSTSLSKLAAINLPATSLSFLLEKKLNNAQC